MVIIIADGNHFIFLGSISILYKNCMV